MDETRMAGTVLAALELAPAEPSDITTILNDPAQQHALLGCADDAATVSACIVGQDGCRHEAPRSDLVEYLVEHLDHGRVEYWIKTLERGTRDGLYQPLCVGHSDYPALLASAWDAPPVLFRSVSESRGPHTFNNVAGQRALAIVGGRDTTSDVLEATEAVAREVATARVRVVSGLAAGVDAAAHRGALDVGGATTAVIGTGIERVYPEANRDLAQEIAEYGVVLSQFAPGAPKTGTTFLRRNSVIAALSHASLVMDGRERSGSRHEIEQAVRHGRLVYLWAPALRRETWAMDLFLSGDALFVDSAAELLADLALSPE